MTVLPVKMPVTTPVVASTVPTAGLLLLHTPLGVVLLSEIVLSSHTPLRPVIAVGV